MIADRVIVELQAKLDQYNSNVLKAQASFERAMSRIQRSAVGAERRVTASAATMAASLTKAFAVAGGIRGLQTLLDSATRIDNALKVAGHSGAELEKVYSRLRDSAMKNAVPLEAMVTLYGRIAQAQDALNVSQKDIENFTEKIGVALRVSGASAQEAAGALLQLSQALGAGIVRAEEYNSINEGARPILQAVAAGLKEAAGDVARLRSLVMDGKVSSEAFFRAFEAGSVILEQKVAGATLTTQQGLTNVATAMVDAMREFSRGSMAAETLGDAFSAMADKINSVDFEAFGRQARELISLINQIREAMGWLQSAGANLGSALGTDAIGDWFMGGSAHKDFLGGAFSITNQRGVQRRIDEAFGAAVETATTLTEDAIRKAAGTVTGSGKTGRLPSSTVTPVSLGDYAPPSSAASGSGRGGRGTRADEYERLSQRIRESTAALQAETAAMAGLNPLVDDYGYAIEKARIQQDLLSAAKKAGIAITPELEANINSLAEGYANATVEAAKLAEAQDKARETAEEWLGVGRDVTQGFISDLLNGASAADSLANALRKVGDALINDILNNIFKINSAGSGGILSSILGFFGGGFRANTTAGAFFGAGTGVPQFAGGTNYAPGGLALVGEKGPELVNLPRGSQVIPNHRLNGQGGQSVVVNFNPVIDARGADPAAIARLETGLAKVRQEMPAQVVESVRKAQKSNVKLG